MKKAVATKIYNAPNTHTHTRATERYCSDANGEKYPLVSSHSSLYVLETMQKQKDNKKMVKKHIHIENVL